MEPPEALRHGWCCPFKRAEHGAGGEVAALRSAWADTGPPRLLGPAFAGETKGECGEAGSNAVHRSLYSSSRRTPGSRARGALGGDQGDMGPPEALRHGWCCPFKRAEHGAGGEAAALRSAWADTGPPRLLGPRFRGENERRERGSWL